MTTSGSGRSVFPIPTVPTPFYYSGPSRRCRQRCAQARRATSLVNNAITGLNTLHTSFARPCLSPRVSSSLVSDSQFDSTGYRCALPGTGVGVSRFNSNQESNAVRQPNAVQQRVQQSTRNSVNRLLRRPPSGVCDDPRSLRDIPRDQFSTVWGYGSVNQSPPVRLVADKVALPSSVGTASLVDLLPPHLAAFYADPSNVVLSAPSTSIRAFVHGTRSEYIKLLGRMWAAGMVTFITCPSAVNSVFCVEKPDGALRLILDARAANAAHVVPPAVQLPTPDLLAGLQTDGSDRPIFCAGTDIADYYYRLRLPEWLVPFFAMPAVRASELSFLCDASGDRLYPAFLVLPMGWSHSVYVAQQAHEHVVYTRTSLRRVDAISKDNDGTIDRVRHSLYIDDLNWFGYDPHELSRLQDEYVSVMSAAGLPVKLSKVTRPTSESCNVLGLCFSGVDHSLGIDGAKLQRLRSRTFGLLQRKVCTGLELSSVVGSWTWYMLTRRPTLAVFNNVYRFIRVARSSTLPLWQSVMAELAVAMSLAPFMVADLRVRWFPHLLASDASASGLGVVRSSLTQQDVTVFNTLTPLPLPQLVALPLAERHNVGSADGVPVTCGGAQLRAERERGLEPVLSQRDWLVVAAAKWRKEEQINVLEARAVSTALRFAMSCPSAFHARVALLCDSTVVCGCLVKGRSSSNVLLRRMRSVSALVIAAHMRLHVVWVPTGVNPADAPSRW